MNREQNEPQIRNPNFRRPIPPPLPQNRQRDMRNSRIQEDRQIRTPFPKNYVAHDDGEKSIEDHTHHFGDLNYEIYLTEEEHNMFAQKDDNKYFEEDLEQYYKGYMHAIDDVQRKIKLRSRDVIMNKGKLNPNQPSSSQMDTKTKKQKTKGTVHKEIENKTEKIKELKQTTPIDVDKIYYVFNLQSELAKLNISIPFNELLRNQEYRDTITKMVRNQERLNQIFWK